MKTFAIFLDGNYMDYVFATNAAEAVVQWAATHTGGCEDLIEATLWQ